MCLVSYLRLFNTIMSNIDTYDYKNNGLSDNDIMNPPIEALYITVTHDAHATLVLDEDYFSEFKNDDTGFRNILKDILVAAKAQLFYDVQSFSSHETVTISSGSEYNNMIFILKFLMNDRIAGNNDKSRLKLLLDFGDAVHSDTSSRVAFRRVIGVINAVEEKYA